MAVTVGTHEYALFSKLQLMSIGKNPEISM